MSPPPPQGSPGIDHQALTCELVRALRAHRSQTALHRRLGYKSNVVYLWESGRRAPTLAQFLWLVHRTGHDVDSLIQPILGGRTLDVEPWTTEGAAQVLDALRGTRPAAELARHLDTSRHTAARWMRGETEPRLPVVLDLIQFCTHSMLSWLSVVVDPATLPSVAPEWERLQAARALLADQPWATAILLALHLEPYRALPAHQPGWLADHLGIDVQVEEDSLAMLLAAGQIHRREGRYEPLQTPMLRLSGARRTQALQGFWARVASERLTAGPTGTASWNLMLVSEDDLQRIREMQQAFLREVRTVMRDSPRAERLVLYNLHLLPLDEEPGDGR